LLKHTQRQGSTLGIRLKVVCATCNNEWMSRLELAAKPWLLPMIQGTSTTIDIIGQSRLVQYFVMKCMVADLSGSSDLIFNQQERTAFYQAREIPDKVQLMLFNYLAPVNQIAQYNKETMRAVSQVDDSQSLKCFGNFTFRFGPVFIQLLCFGEYSPSPIQDNFITLFPIQNRNVDWPPRNSLTTDLAFLAQHAMEMGSRHAGLPVRD
jgi:hypothetical protein